jgi:hypothetical protein
MAEAKDRERTGPAQPKSIQRLYEVFARYPARPDMPRCPHCANDKEIAYICSNALWDLSEGNLYYYAWHAITTVGEPADFKHFLPRIFETMVYQGGSIDREVIAGKLGLALWREWPRAEQDAVVSFFREWWDHVLSCYPGECEADEALCSIARVGEDLTSYLDTWRKAVNPEALRHLAATIAWNNGDLIENKGLPNGWWEESPTQMSQLRDWLLSPLTGKALEAAFFKYADAPFAKEFSDAVQQFGWVREALSKSHPEP